MCHQIELLIAAAFFGVIAAILLPCFQALGWRWWFAIPLSFMSAFVIGTALVMVFEGGSRVCDWCYERRKKQKQQQFNKDAK